MLRQQITGVLLRWLKGSVVAVLTSAIGWGSAGCERCGYTLAFFPSQKCAVEERAIKALDCPNSKSTRSETTELSSTDADTYSVCCTHGSRACVQYVCPKGRPDAACYRE